MFQVSPRAELLHADFVRNTDRFPLEHVVDGNVGSLNDTDNDYHQQQPERIARKLTVPGSLPPIIG